MTRLFTEFMTHILRMNRELVGFKQVSFGLVDVDIFLALLQSLESIGKTPKTISLKRCSRDFSLFAQMICICYLFHVFQTCLTSIYSLLLSNAINYCQAVYTKSLLVICIIQSYNSDVNSSPVANSTSFRTGFDSLAKRSSGLGAQREPLSGGQIMVILQKKQNRNRFLRLHRIKLKPRKKTCQKKWLAAARALLRLAHAFLELDRREPGLGCPLEAACEVQQKKPWGAGKKWVKNCLETEHWKTWKTWTFKCLIN